MGGENEEDGVAFFVFMSFLALKSHTMGISIIELQNVTRVRK